ncbi:MAG TPA: SusC/RagA family TonB-linked outer membrane protein, partial [Cyclobacteriaceae bacterium]|nr:SusC/RagA family TonB-linked outer membrane protein [Cyclobacteriaceae bacterium]
RTVKGRITSAEDGSALPGVNVVLKGTTTGTVTDSNGEYSLSVPSSGGFLVFSFIGLRSQEIEIGSKSTIDVPMSSDVQQLNEVVITGSLGLQRQEKEIGYAASIISTAELTRAKAIDVAQSLNGKISGLNITTTNGGVFSNAKINIRGVRSLTGNNQPMLVVDGAQVPYEVLGVIPPDDIDDITILKSGSSAALYGPDAVNGVLVVTTKRGKGATNENPTVSITSSYQATRVAYFPKLQHSFGAGAGEVVDGYGNYGYVPYENQIYGPRFDGSIKDIGIATQEEPIAQKGVYSPIHKDDKTKFWNTGSTFQNTVSLQGHDYYISFSDAQIKGLMPDDQNRRTAIRINGDKKVKNFSFNYSLGYTAGKSNVVNEAQLQNAFQGAYSGSIMFAVMQTPDNVPLLSYKNTKSGWGKFDNYYNEFAFNPYWVIQNLRSLGTNNNFIGNATLGYEIKPWLKATARFASATTDSRTDNIQNPLNLSEWTLAHRNATTYQNVKGSVTNSMQRGSLFNIDYFLNGKTKVSNNLTFSYVVGGNFRETMAKNETITGNNLVADLPNITIRSGDAVILGYNSGNNFNLHTRRVSGYGMINFGFKDWAFVEVTGRNDWDSRLAKANRSLFYPGANVSLVLSDAIPSLKGNTISYLKLRGAYSKSGNVNLGPYSLHPTYSPPLGFPFGSNAGFSADPIYPSANLKPETVTTTEVGLELSVLNNRIDFNATYFNSACNNQILSTSLPFSTGYSNGLANAASFTNSGVEMDLGLAKVKIGSGNFSFKVNATYNTNKVTKTPNGDPVILTGTGNFTQISRGSPTANNIAIVGHPAFQFQLSDYERDPATGKVIVDRYTGNPSQSTQLTIMGRSLPLWIFGFTPKYEIGGLTLSMTWDYKTGHNFYSGIGSDMDFSGISARSASYGRKRFVFPHSVYKGDDGKYVDNKNIQIQDGNYGFWTGSSTNTAIATNYFASAAALRLREVNITYQVPTKWVSKTKYIKKISVSLIGRNLLLFVPKSNQWGDPEYNYSSTGNTAGLSSAFMTPSGRMYGASVNFTL